MDVSASSMCDSTTTSFQLVNKDDNCVIVQSVQHAAMYPHRIAIARMITRRTQHHPLSAPSDHPSHGYAMRVHGSMLQVIGVRKPVSRLPRADCSDQHCGPERAWCNGPLSIVEYHAFSISHGQESACGGRIRPHGLAVSVLNNHEYKSLMQRAACVTSTLTADIGRLSASAR